MIINDLIADCCNYICRCCIPDRKEHRGTGCFKRCGNPCRRIAKRCNECLGRPNYAPTEENNMKERTELETKVVAQEEIQPAEEVQLTGE